MTYQDMTVTCHDCSSDFVFTAFEQDFYAMNNFTYEIECCRNCRRKRGTSVATTIRRVGPGMSEPRFMRDTTCYSCDRTIAVSFAPRFGKPVYCPDCYEKFGRRHV